MADVVNNNRMLGSVTRAGKAALAGAIFLAAPVAAEAVPLSQLLEEIRVEFTLPALAAAVVQNGEVVTSAAMGTRMLGKDLPVTVEDRFHLGSNTKSMTATLAGMMVEEGKLAWESTIAEVLPEHAEGMSSSLAAATLEVALAFERHSRRHS